MHIFGLKIGPHDTIGHVCLVMPGTRIDLTAILAVRMQPGVRIGETIVVVLYIHGPGEAVVFEVVFADDELGLLFGLPKTRHYDRQQKGDDSYDN